MWTPQSRAAALRAKQAKRSGQKTWLERGANKLGFHRMTPAEYKAHAAIMKKHGMTPEGKKLVTKTKSTKYSIGFEKKR